MSIKLASRFWLSLTIVVTVMPAQAEHDHSQFDTVKRLRFSSSDETERPASTRSSRPRKGSWEELNKLRSYGDEPEKLTRHGSVKAAAKKLNSPHPTAKLHHAAVQRSHHTRAPIGLD